MTEAQIKAAAMLKWRREPGHWPHAVHAISGEPAARITADVSFTPYRAKRGALLTIHVMANRGWLTLPSAARTLADAKQLAAEYFERNPHERR